MHSAPIPFSSNIRYSLFAIRYSPFAPEMNKTSRWGGNNLLALSETKNYSGRATLRKH
jgi:hypothetical protein